MLLGGEMALPTYGTMAVDWEQRVDFDRLRRERLGRAKKLLSESSMGALPSPTIRRAPSNKVVADGCATAYQKQTASRSRPQDSSLIERIQISTSVCGVYQDAFVRPYLPESSRRA